MKQTPLVMALKTRLTGQEWVYTLAALRQDKLIWEALDGSRLGAQALGRPPHSTGWGPAALALLALDSPLSPAQLQAAPLEALPEAWQAWVNGAKAELEQPGPRQGGSASDNALETLRAAAWQALRLRESYRAGASWREALHSAPLVGAQGLCCAAIAYGLLPDAGRFLRALVQTDGRAGPMLAVHALLCQPQPEEALYEQVNALLGDLPPAHGLAVLRELALHRPSQSQRLAKRFLADQAAVWAAPRPETASADLGEQFYSLAGSLRLAQTYQLAADLDTAMPLLAESLREMSRLRGHLLALFAQAVSMAHGPHDEDWNDTAQETSLEAWRQALHMAPDEHPFVAGLVGALLQADRAMDARAYLERRQADGDHHPTLTLAWAQVAARLDNHKEAASQAAQTVHVLDAQGCELALDEYRALVQLLSDEGLAKESLRAARLGLEVYPLDPILLRQAAQTAFTLGEVEAALGDACTALAGLGLQQPADEDAIRALHGLMVQALEAQDEWAAALEERSQALAENPHPTLDELHAMMVCAQHAGQGSPLAAASRQALALAPNDLDAHQALARLAQAAGDDAGAALHFEHAARLAPDQPDLWRGLVQAIVHLDQPEQTVKTLQQAIQAMPQEGEFHLVLGEAYQRQGSMPQALQCFRTAAKLGCNGRTPLRLGQTLLRMGLLEEAQAVLEPAFAAPMAQEALPAALAAELAYAVAQTRLGLDRLDEAAPLLEQVVAWQPEAAQPRLELARALMRSPQTAPAARQALPHLEWLTQAHHANVNGETRGEALVLLSEAYAAVGETSKAMHSFRQALDEPANQAAGLRIRLATGLGKAALGLDQPEMAAAALKDAVQAQPDNADLHRSLAEAYLACGLAPESLQAAQENLRLQPENVENLVWLADHADRLRAVPGVHLDAVQRTLQQALTQAGRYAPKRGDLLLRLGLSHLEAGDLTRATQSFRRLASADLPVEQLSGETLKKGAEAALQCGEGPAAVRLYQALASRAPEAEATQPAARAQLLAQLSLAHEMAGDAAAALQAIDQALGVDDEQAALHVRKADLLQAAGRRQDALDSLSEAAGRAPHDPRLRYRLADTLRQSARLPEAFEQAMRGVEHLVPHSDPALRSSLHLLAADLAADTLRPRLALEQLLSGAPADSPAYHDFQHVARRAELALDVGDDALAAEAVAELRALDNTHPRTHAAEARLRNRVIDLDERDRRCRAARNAITRMRLEQTPTVPPSTKADYIASFLGVAQALIESRMFDDALSVVDRLIEMIPETPLAYFKRAQLLTLKAEAQRLCQDVDVTRHAPGAAAISEAQRQEMENAFGQAAGLLGMPAVYQETPAVTQLTDACRQTLALWMGRGRAAFTPSVSTAGVLEGLLRATTPDSAALAALMAAYRGAGRPALALQCLQIAWTPAADGRDVRAHALVGVQKALAQPDPRQALTDARSCVENAAPDWPNIAMLHFLTARLALACQAMEAALTAIGQALAIWPDEPRWQSLAAQLYQSKQQAIGLPDHAKAMQHLQQAVALDPQEAQNHLGMGRIYIEKGQIARAITALEQAVHLQPESGPGWLALAQAQAAASLWEAAALSADKAIAALNEPTDALLLRGRIAMQSNNPRGALSKAQAVLRLQPEHSEALHLAAQALEALDRPLEALKVLDHALLSSSDPLTLQLERANVQRRAQGLEAALPGLQALAEQNPQRTDIAADLANWLLEAGENDAAVQTARQALQDEHNNLTPERRAGLHALIGMQMRASGQLDQAIQHLSEASNLAPSNPEMLMELGRAYQERRQYKSALKVFQKAMSVSPGDYRPYYQAGLVLKDSKDYLAAEAMLRRAVQLAPDEVSIRRLLGAVMGLVIVHGSKL